MRAPLSEERRVVAERMAATGEGGGIGGVDSGHMAQHGGDVVNVTGHGAGGVIGEPERNDAVTTEQAAGGLKAGDAIGGGGASYGTTGGPGRTLG